MESVCFRGCRCNRVAEPLSRFTSSPWDKVSLNLELIILLFVLSWAGSSGLCFPFSQQWNCMLGVLIKFLCCCDNTDQKQTVEGKGLFHFITLRSWAIVKKCQDKNLEAGTEAQITEECCVLNLLLMSWSAFFFFLFLFFLFNLLLYMYACLHVCALCAYLMSLEVRRGYWIPGTRFVDGCKPPGGCWNCSQCS